MTRIFAVANQKGGVGKSVSTLNLGGALAEKGKRVLLVDLDPQGSLTQALLGTETYWSLQKGLYDAVRGKVDLSSVVQQPKQNLAIVPTNIELSGAELELVNEVSREKTLSRLLTPLASQYDFMLIDCPPSLGLLTINGLSAAQKVIIPVECKFLSINGIRLLMQTIDKVKRFINAELEVFGILPTRLDVRIANSRESLNVLQIKYGMLVLPFIVKERASVADAPVARQVITEFDPKSDAAEAYRGLAEEVIRRG